MPPTSLTPTRTPQPPSQARSGPGPKAIPHTSRAWAGFDGFSGRADPCVLCIPALWMLSGPRQMGEEGGKRTTDEEPAQFCLATSWQRTAHLLQVR